MHEGTAVTDRDAKRKRLFSALKFSAYTNTQKFLDMKEIFRTPSIYERKQLNADYSAFVKKVKSIAIK